jgi:signal transduction histidine kinase
MRFTKLNPPALEPRNVNELVRKVVAKYEGAMAKGVTLELNLEDKLPFVALDEEGVENVLDIVIENAIEAMGPVEGSRQNVVGRVLRIRTAVSSRESVQCHSEGVGRFEESRLRDPSTKHGVTKASGSSVRIEVEDTGAGIPEKYLDKVFEPYFTHGKPDGTGLGLALAKKIVEDHKGQIVIQSREGIGTTVIVTLPAERKANA